MLVNLSHPQREKTHGRLVPTAVDSYNMHSKCISKCMYFRLIKQTNNTIHSHNATTQQCTTPMHISRNYFIYLFIFLLIYNFFNAGVQIQNIVIIQLSL